MREKRHSRTATRSGRTLVLLGMLFLSACAASKVTTPPPQQFAQPLDRYEIGRLDKLSVKFFYTPELNEDVVVRPDGCISLALIGDVEVAGRSPDEVVHELRRRYSPYMETRDVAVIMRETASARAYVGGEVQRPSMLNIDGAMTVIDAIMLAGGAKDTAALGSVVLLRAPKAGADGKSKPEAFRIDVEAAIRGEVSVPALRPYDVVFIPKSPIGELGTYVDLYLNRIIPRNTSFAAFYNINPELQVP